VAAIAKLPRREGERPRAAPLLLFVGLRLRYSLANE
jgi:hypothetical protein